MAQIRLKHEEIELLLTALKTSLINSIAFPIQGKCVDFMEKSITDGELFSIHIYRGKVNPQKYNICALIQKYNVPILELHIGPGNKHINPDGTIISGNHWHIYSETYGRAQAFPADDIYNDQFVSNTITFLDKFNVIDKPNVYFQLEML